MRSERIENKEKTQEFLERISELKAGIETGLIDVEKAEKQVIELENEVDETLISEETRRETVTAIVKQLQKQEFTVEKPQLIKTDGKNYPESVKLVVL